VTTSFDDHQRTQWAGRAAAYRDSLAALCAHPADRLLDAAGVAAGTRVLDVGTGTGTVAARAAARGARVSAVDAEPSMIDLARRRLPGADLRLAVLPHLPFPDGHFDAVVANFVLNHVGDPGAAVREMRRVVRAGGRLAVTIWPHPPPPAQRLWDTVFDAAGVRRPADLPAVAPDRDFARTGDGLTGLLRRAGLDGAGCTEIGWTHRTDAEAWWNGPASGLGATGRVLRRQDPATVVRIRRHYDELVEAFRDTDGRLALPTAALLGSGVAA
jgi:SAM-dependent methyltransferase